jgi:hypothetical protein
MASPVALMPAQRIAWRVLILGSANAAETADDAAMIAIIRANNLIAGVGDANGDSEGYQQLFQRLIAALRASSFAALPAPFQDAMLERPDLIQDVMAAFSVAVEGMYANPEYGGNQPPTPAAAHRLPGSVESPDRLDKRVIRGRHAAARLHHVRPRRLARRQRQRDRALRRDRRPPGFDRRSRRRPARAYPRAARADPGSAREHPALKEQMATRRAIVIGSGAGGSMVARALARSGKFKVTIFEKGANYFENLTDANVASVRTRFSNDELKFGTRSFINPDPLVDPRSFRTSTNVEREFVGEVNTLPQTVGGGLNHADWKARRFRRADFRLADIAAATGQDMGTGVANWPIGYDELEKFYTAVEYVVGVQGPAAAISPRAQPRSIRRAAHRSRCARGAAVRGAAPRRGRDDARLPPDTGPDGSHLADLPRSPRVQRLRLRRRLRLPDQRQGQPRGDVAARRAARRRDAAPQLSCPSPRLRDLRSDHRIANVAYIDENGVLAEHGRRPEGCGDPRRVCDRGCTAVPQLGTRRAQ